MPTSLLAIANKARTSRKHRFQNLYHLLNRVNLRTCFYELKKNAAPGVDKVKWETYWLKAGILEPDLTMLHPETGTPQGGIVSPILANIYLHYALDLWFEHIVKPKCRGRVLIIRYVDDFVCAFQYHDDAAQFQQMLEGRLGKFRLSLAPEKTRSFRFNRFFVANA